MKIKSGYFNKAYWEDRTRSGYDSYNFFRGDHLHQAKALMLKDVYGDVQYLIAGCAKGWVVEELCNVGIDALGFDISKWAIKNGGTNVARSLYVSDGLNGDFFVPNAFDTIATFETAEHVAEKDIPTWLGNFYKWLKPGGSLFATICIGHGNIRGEDDNDKSHQTLLPRDWWEEQIESVGFVLDDVSYAKACNSVVTTKERDINIVQEMGWHLFTYRKPEVQL